MLVVDGSQSSVDRRLRARMITGLVEAARRQEGLTVKTPSPPPGSDAPAKIARILEQAKKLSQRFKETEALVQLERAEKIFRRHAPRMTAVAPLVKVLLASAKLKSETGDKTGARLTLRRIAILAPKLTLDPGVYAPELVKTLRGLNARLKKGKQATLRVTCSSGKAAVWIDGEDRGETPLSSKLRPGEHFVAVERDGAIAGRAVFASSLGTTMVKLELPAPATATDNDLRALGKREGAAWVIVARIVERAGDKLRIVLSALSTATVAPAREQKSKLVDAAGLTWAVSEVALEIPQLIGEAGRSGDGKDTPSTRRRKKGSGSILTRWWFWTIIGAAVVGAGAATTAVLLTRDGPGVRLVLEP